LIRALEICIGTGRPYSSYLNQEKTPRDFKTIYIGLEAERDVIYDRINKRVDLMLEDGLLKEAEPLLEHKSLNALQTVGYRELFNFLENKWSLEFAVSEIKKNTRRFAKRQLTWYRKNSSIFRVNYNEDYNKIINNFKKHLLTELNG
jgi:tRNA dimethylallyltransferase